MMTPPRIAVIGSINMDLVIRLPRIPRPGESVIGGDLARFAGGKGANQAVAAARLGAEAMLVGRVGDDDFGRSLLATLRENGVNIDYVGVTPGVATGVGCISLSAAGENAIAVGPGANMRVTTADIDAAAGEIRRCRVCLLQLELPLLTVAYALRRCRAMGVETVLDYAPAPAQAVAELFAADVITPNEVEAAMLAAACETAAPDRLSSRSPGTDAHDRASADSPPDWERLARIICARGPGSVVLKLGARGAFLHTQRESLLIPPFPIEPVDTVGAGDAFTAGLGVAIAEGQPWPDAVRFANAAGALACLTPGAIPSMPDRAAVARLLSGAVPVARAAPAAGRPA